VELCLTFTVVWLLNFGCHPKVKVKVKLSLCLTKHHTMKTYRESGGIILCALISAVDGVSA
jgi:hypothetical protein